MMRGTQKQILLGFISHTSCVGIGAILGLMTPFGLAVLLGMDPNATPESLLPLVLIFGPALFTMTAGYLAGAFCWLRLVRAWLPAETAYDWLMNGSRGVPIVTAKLRRFFVDAYPSAEALVDEDVGS